MYGLLVVLKPNGRTAIALGRRVTSVEGSEPHCAMRIIRTLELAEITRIVSIYCVLTHKHNTLSGRGSCTALSHSHHHPGERYRVNGLNILGGHRGFGDGRLQS